MNHMLLKRRSEAPPKKKIREYERCLYQSNVRHGTCVLDGRRRCRGSDISDARTPRGSRNCGCCWNFRKLQTTGIVEIPNKRCLDSRETSLQEGAGSILKYLQRNALPPLPPPRTLPKGESRDRRNLATEEHHHSQGRGTAPCAHAR